MLVLGPGEGKFLGQIRAIHLDGSICHAQAESMRRMHSSEFHALRENDQGRFLAALGSALGVRTGEAELRDLAYGIWEEPASDSSAASLVERPREVVPAAKPEGAGSRPAAAPPLVGGARAGHFRFGGAGGPPGGR